MPNTKEKILVHVCCGPCASYVFSELEKEKFEIIAIFYNPEIHGRAEYKKRLEGVSKICSELNIKLIIPEYNIQDFLAPLMPFQDQHSIKFISDRKRYRRKRCQLCISNLMNNLIYSAKKLKVKIVSSTMLCSPYRDHDEIVDYGTELAIKEKLLFYYQDFRKGYWKGRNFARNHDIIIPSYCGCSESLEEGRLE